jgi:hypothetical protein
LACSIHAQGHDQAFLAKVLSVNQQCHQMGGHWALQELLQLGDSHRFPLPTDAGFINALSSAISTDETGSSSLVDSS